MLQKEFDYIKGNTIVNPNLAPLDPNTEKQYERLKKVKKNKRIRQKLRKREIIKSYIQIIAAVFIVGMIVIWGDNKIYKAQDQLNQLKNSISTMQNENEALKITVLKSSSITELRNTAEKKIKMINPTKDNIIYVDLKKNNFKSNEVKDTEVNKGILSKIKDFVLSR